LEIINRSDDVQGFEVLPRRWVARRTFAWFGRYRRFSEDYEFYPETGETVLQIAIIHIMLRRLAPTAETGCTFQTHPY